MLSHLSVPRRGNGGFTLIEMLAAMAVLIVLLGIVVAVTNSVSTTVRRSTAGIDALANARTGFDLINRSLSQATLSTYWDYDNPLQPTEYVRQSDLQFLVRQNIENPGYGQEVYFVAPETYSTTASLRSTRGLLNGCSFFIHYGSSADFRPTGQTGEKFRYRLMFGIQPTEKLSIFKRDARTAGQSEADYRSKVQTFWNSLAWITDIENGANDVGDDVDPVADNVIALVIWPRLSTNEDPTGLILTPSSYDYNSQRDAMTFPQALTANQLPPMVQITMIAISEASASRLDDGTGNAPALIQDALSNRFTDPKNYEVDIKAVSEKLSSSHIDFQIFSTSVPLKESKWSRAQ
jgi:uncharacterized protein (TIGR02599 family)